MRILFVVSTLERTGPVRQLLNIVKNLCQDPRFSAKVLTLSIEKENSYWNDYVADGICVDSLRLSRFEGVFLAKSELKRIIGNFKPSVIHTQGIRADCLVGDLRKNFKHICTIRNLPQLDYAMTYGKLVGRFMCRYHMKSIKHVDFCVGVSSAVTNNLEFNFHLEQALTIRNGVDTDFFFPIQDEKINQAREKLGLPIGKKIWIACGNLDARKDPVFIIRSFKRKFEGDGENILLLIGDGVLRSECEREAEKGNDVFVVGSVTNVRDYLRCADVFISASKAEGMPNAVLEALACGLPVILSDIEPHVELFCLNMQIGQLFKLGSQQSLVDSMRELEKTGKQKLKKAVNEIVEEHVSSNVMVDQYKRIYLDHVG